MRSKRKRARVARRAAKAIAARLPPVWRAALERAEGPTLFDVLAAERVEIPFPRRRS